MSTCLYCETEFDADDDIDGCCCVACAEAYDDEQVLQSLRRRVSELSTQNAELTAEVAELRGGSDEDGLIPPTAVATAKVERICAERLLERQEPPLRVVQNGWGGLSMRFTNFSLDVSKSGDVRRYEHSVPF